LTTISTNFIGYIFEDKAGNIWLSEIETKGMASIKYDGKVFSTIAKSVHTNIYSKLYK